MGTSSSKVPPYEVIQQPLQEQASSSGDKSRSSLGSFSPPREWILQQPSSPGSSSSNVRELAPVLQGPPPPLPQGWDFHMDRAIGYPYFYNTTTGESQWQDPRGPGFALPERSVATHLGQRRQVIPPWEGGPIDVDPLSWPLPPGWHEQHDQTTDQRYFVNYNARIVSNDDPRLDIAKAYRQRAEVGGIPVNYPPSAIGGPMDEQPVPFELDPLCPAPPVRSPGPMVQGSASYLPPPPPPWKKKGRSLWSNLGFHGLWGTLPSVLALTLFENPELPNGNEGSDSSSSSSSDEGDDNKNEGSIDGPIAADSNGQFSSGIPGNVDDGDSNDRRALDEYGGPSTTVYGGDTRSGLILGNGGYVSNESGVQQSLFGSWHPQGKDGYFQSWDDGLKPQLKGREFCSLDGYTRVAILLIVVVGSYFGIFEGILCFALAFSGTLILIMCKRVKMAKVPHKMPSRRFRDRVRWYLKRKDSTLASLKMAANLQFFQIQAWCFEHLYVHPHVEVRMLTEKDNASPLFSSKLLSRPREITIVTQASADRLPALEAMATSWGGVICVAIHVRTRAELGEVYPRLCALHERIEAQGHCRLNICVAKEEGFSSDDEAMSSLYPVNAMRNIALSMATTDLVFILDADFIPSVGMHELLTVDETTYSEYLRMARVEHQVLVVPAFEGMPAKDEEAKISQIVYPKTMHELREQWKEGFAKAFHCSHFPRGHEPTNYERFFSLSTSKPYIVPYKEFYEPYVICAREVIPPFDARFRGYGLNKISHAFHCAVKGIGFCVLPQVFVWSLPHCKSEAWAQTFGEKKDPLQKLRILGLYRRFKSEVELLHKLEQKKIAENGSPELLEIKVEQQPQLPRCIELVV